jgi:plasmid stabilization system protein ParE
MVEALQRLGATEVMAVAGSRGTGPLPAVPSVVLGTTAGTMMEGIRLAEAAMAQLPAEARQSIEAFDPGRRARVLRPIFGGLDDVADRPVFGARPEAWRRLEDKTLADGIWDAAGVPRLPSRVVEVRADALMAAATALDGGAGTVWAADNRLGFHGGAELTRWVVDGSDADEALDLFRASADRVRVMPFVEGRPCSIHGWVVDGRVLAFRPIEMVMLRRGRRFQYAGCASYWDPPAGARAAMRQVARRVGAWLHEAVGYRGAFTVDGVLGRLGFVPTELNPRFGAGLMVLGAHAGLPLYLLHCATVAGVAPPGTSHAERGLVRRMDRHRGSSCHVGVPTVVREERALAFSMRGDEAVAASPTDADGSLLLGSSPTGGFLRVLLDSARTPVGPSVAARVASALALGAEAFGVEAAGLVAAPEVSGGQSR